jgi:hypothetical protein
MAREFVYQYNGRANLRDTPEIVPDGDFLPVLNSIVRRHGTNYRVVSIHRVEAATLPRYVIDLQPLDEFPADSSD